VKTLSEFRPGDTFELSRICDRYRPIYYAAASGDFNPIHVDPEVGRLAGQPGAILQGMCTLAWLAEACLRYFDDPARMTGLSARFARPVNVGDTIRFEGRCVAVEGRRVQVAVRVTNQRGEEVLARAQAEATVEGDGP